MGNARGEKMVHFGYERMTGGVMVSLVRVESAANAYLRKTRSAKAVDRGKR
jgi:hypothetical protein